MKKSDLVLLFSALFSVLISFGQDSSTVRSFDASMQFRPRFEYRNGYSRPLAKEEKAAALVSNRLRLNLGYESSDFLKAKISLQDVSLWGQNPPIQGVNQQNNSFGLFEGWVDLKIYKRLRARIGRQTIILDDQRLFSETNWSQGGRSHDALALYFSTDKFNINTYFAFNQNYNELYAGNLNNPSGNFYNPSGAQPYKYMQTLRMGYQTSKNSKASFIFSNIGYQNVDLQDSNPDETVANLQTTGLNYTLNANPVKIKLTGYYQFGKNLDNTDVSAYLLSAGINGQIAPDFTLGIRSDYLSGNSLNQSGETNHAFSTLFGTGHPFYGQMDYYPYADVGIANQVITANYAPPDKINLKATGHFYFATSKFERNGNKYHSNIGQELDINFDYAIRPYASLNAGYSVYFTNDNILALKQIPDAKSMTHWFWVGLNIHPELFQAKF